ncbi:GFA family protein [Roseibium sp. HPY-6]|uniref:GFA family protein n=1 Tax=Roseibium sp. HPY-6 TaxID=3229852 RepID=UPI0033901351
MRRSGSCLCGQVTFSADAIPRLQACHCSMCRKWVGGPFMAVPCKDAEFEGPVQRYASSDGFERGFCSVCGSNLFFHPIGSGIHGIPIGLFDDQTELPFKAEFFIDQKPENYSFSDVTRKMTGEEFAHKFRNG